MRDAEVTAQVLQRALAAGHERRLWSAPDSASSQNWWPKRIAQVDRNV